MSKDDDLYFCPNCKSYTLRENLVGFKFNSGVQFRMCIDCAKDLYENLNNVFEDKKGA